MANAAYPLWKQELIKASANTALNSANVRVAFLDTGTYTYSAAHDFYNDLSGVWPNTRGTGIALTTRTYVNGLLDADDSLFAAFSNGSVSLEGIVMYVDSGADATSSLVMYLDTGITGMPFTPSGADVTIQWNASGIMQL